MWNFFFLKERFIVYPLSEKGNYWLKSSLILEWTFLIVLARRIWCLILIWCFSTVLFFTKTYSKKINQTLWKTWEGKLNNSLFLFSKTKRKRKRTNSCVIMNKIFLVLVLILVFTSVLAKQLRGHENEREFKDFTKKNHKKYGS